MAIKVDDKVFYTVKEVAAALHVTPQSIRTWVKNGKLDGGRVGAQILITEASLRKLLNSLLP